jgi:hypothetical protein
MNSITIEDVVNRIDELPEFARESVTKAYEALKEMYAASLCKCMLGYNTESGSHDTNIIRSGLGKPRKQIVRIEERNDPIVHCKVEVWPMLEPILKVDRHGVPRDEGGNFMSLDQVRKQMPESFNAHGVRYTKFHEWQNEPNVVFYAYDEDMTCSSEKLHD